MNQRHPTKEHAMEYRDRSLFESTTWVLLRALQYIGILSIVWNLLKPEGWLSMIIDLVAADRPTSYYFLGAGALTLFAGKRWLDSLGPNAFANFLAAGGGFAGSYFVLRLLPF
jgi:hypothetical protein